MTSPLTNTYLYLTILTTFLTCNQLVQGQGASSSTGTDLTPSTVDDPDLNTVAASIHYVAFASQWISIPGSIFIILYTWYYRAEISKKGPAHRFPLYISIADIGFTTSHFIDHMIVLNTHHYPTYHVCRLFGWFFQFMSIATIMNVMSVSLYCAYTVTYLKKPDVGKYDWKLLAWGFGIPFIFSFVPFMTNSYGHDAAWCWIDQSKPNAHLGYIVIPYLLFLAANIMVLLVIFYRLATANNNTKTNMVKRSILFVAAYVFQFTPIIVFSIQVYVGVDVPYNTILFVVFNINLGGFLNVIVYGFGILQFGAAAPANTDSQIGNNKTRASVMSTAGGSGNSKDKEKDHRRGSQTGGSSVGLSKPVYETNNKLESPRAGRGGYGPPATPKTFSYPPPSPTATESTRTQPKYFPNVSKASPLSQPISPETIAIDIPSNTALTTSPSSSPNSSPTRMPNAAPASPPGNAGLTSFVRTGSVGSPTSPASPRRFQVRIHTSATTAPPLMNLVRQITTPKAGAAPVVATGSDSTSSKV